MEPHPQPPVLGSVTFASAEGVDTISYPPPVPGSAPVLGVALFVGSTQPGGRGKVPMINLSGEAGSFTRPSPDDPAAYYAVLAFDESSPPLVSLPESEPIAGPAGAWDPPPEEVRAFVRDFLMAKLTPELLRTVEDECRAD